ILLQSLLSSSFGKESTATIKRGLLWQQRKKLFSRWKERYFILTRDYLYCFQRASGADKISEMGQFLFKVKLVDIERVEWENKKTYSIVALVMGRDGKIYLRTPDGLEDWFELIEECTMMSKERRRALRHSHDGRPKDNNNTTASLGEWLAAHHKLRKKFVFQSTLEVSPTNKTKTEEKSPLAYTCLLITRLKSFDM
ncbi:PH domain containing protein, partial [Asbolus verrucosus]